MKKLLTAIAALVLGSTAAFAQFGEQLINFSPEYGSELSSRNTTITITPSAKALMLAPEATGVLVQGVAGQSFNQLPMEPVYRAFDKGTQIVSFPLTDASWALPYFEVYYLQMFAVLADANGTPIISEDLEDYVMGITAYTTPDYAPAAWALNYPNERNFTNEGLTFKRFYEAGICTFYFTKEVNVAEGSIGTITYVDINDIDEEVEIDSFTTEWDDMQGLYAITVDIETPLFTADELQSIEVKLNNVTSTSSVIEVPAIYVENKVNPQVAPRNKKGIESGLVSGNENVNVYNLQGILVKENVDASTLNELPAGIYIVNGKKVAIR